MKRPRWPGGVGGTVGGAAGRGTTGGVGCTVARGGSGRGVTTGGVVGAGAGGGSSTTGGGGGGCGSAVCGARDFGAQPLSSARVTTAAMLLLTSLLRGIG